MTHEQLKNILFWAMGDRVAFDARETWSKFLTSKSDTFFLNYDWIKRKEFYTKAENDERLDLGTGAQGVRVWIRENEM